MGTDNRITIIGTGQTRDISALAAHPALAGADALIGSARALAALHAVNARKIPVKAPVAAILDSAAALLEEGKTVVVIANGDPLFHSIGTSFTERFGPDRLTVLPAVSSVQAAAAKFGMPLDNVRTVSAHGRQNVLALAHAAMDGMPVCLLTDARNTPRAAARFLLSRGVTGFTVRVAADLGGAMETLWHGSLAEAAERTFPDPNLVFFLPDSSLPAPRTLCPGQPENAFIHEGALITKWPVRAAVLAALRIEPRHVVWDLGAGSGSVALEAASLARRGRVVAVEREKRRIRHIEENRLRFGAANLDIVHAAMPDCLAESYAASGPDCTGSPLPRPDRIFLGGGLGGAAEDAVAIFRRSWERLAPDGRLVAACVLLGSVSLARETLLSLDPHVETTLIQASAAATLGNDAHLTAMNPVWCIAAQKREQRAAEILRGGTR